VPSESLIGLIVSVICVAILMLVFRYTKIGLAMRATAEDLQVVQSVGIRATTVYAVSWVIASVVGVIGGILLGAFPARTWNSRISASRHSPWCCWAG